MTMKIPFLFSEGNLTVVLNGQSKSVPETHHNFKAILEVLKEKDGDVNKLTELLVGSAPQVKPPEPVLVNLQKDHITIVNGVAYFDGEVIDCPGLNEYIQSLARFDMPFDGLVKFLERLFVNVRFRVRGQLFLFMNKVGLIIDSDGFIFAYKAVTVDYLDRWTEKIDNHPGQSPRMDPGKVCDDPNLSCGPGLHAGGLGYVHDYGNSDNRIIIVKIDPADVVSIPYDCGCQKLRTCGYYVVGDYNGELQCPVYEAGSDTAEMYKKDSGLSKEQEDDVNDFFEKLEEDDDSDMEDDSDVMDDDFDDDSEVEDEDDDDGDHVDDKVESIDPPKPQGTVAALTNWFKSFHNVRDNKGRFTKPQ
jgi:hypothetical protein